MGHQHRRVTPFQTDGSYTHIRYTYNVPSALAMIVSVKVSYTHTHTHTHICTHS